MTQPKEEKLGVSIYLRPAEKTKLRVAAAKAGLTMSEYIRLVLYKEKAI